MRWIEARRWDFFSRAQYARSRYPLTGGNFLKVPPSGPPFKKIQAGLIASGGEAPWGNRLAKPGKTKR